MRNVIRAGLLALTGLTLGAADAAAQGAKIAYINSQTILQRAPGRAQAEDAYNTEMAGYRTQLQAMGDSLEKMVADYRKAEATLSQADKEAQQLRIRTRQEAYQKRAGDLEQQAQKRQFELVGPIMEQIRRSARCSSRSAARRGTRSSSMPAASRA
jgi:outer membrane protein